MHIDETGTNRAKMRREWSGSLKNRAARATPLAGRRVLIVEDEVFVAMDLVIGCEATGARVTSAPTLDAAAEAIRKADGAQPFDVAVVDLQLEREQSTPIIDMLRKRAVPFVLYTGNIGGEQSALGGGAPVIHKPVLPETVIERLCALLNLEGFG